MSKLDQSSSWESVTVPATVSDLREEPQLKNKMKSVSYKDHLIELVSHRLRSGGWVARATVIIHEANTVKKIPIFGRRRASFDTRREADAYALELARLWVEGRIWGANGHG